HPLRQERKSRCNDVAPSAARRRGVLDVGAAPMADRLARAAALWRVHVEGPGSAAAVGLSRSSSSGAQEEGEVAGLASSVGGRGPARPAGRGVGTGALAG